MPCWKSARPASAALSLLLLTACGQPTDQPAAAPPQPPAAAPPEEPPAQAPAPAALGWSYEDNALVLREDRAEILRIACVAKTELAVQVEAFRPVESEERMSAGAGNTVVTLVAAADSDGLVKGEGPIDADFVRAVGEGRKIAVNYGFQNAGPYNGPPAEVAGAFASGCS